ncbi:hypothetical protein AAF712_005545 [Marasmius tenuissimus]|uniref:F-box domain-containing protein n=1 Tax=Marasmius tenuissimus TaxID=585030 RepID=A0ABR3A1X6_9AGAR
MSPYTVSPSKKLPNETILQIFHECTAEEFIHVRALSERPINTKQTTLYALSAVSRRWRELSGDLPGWRRVVIDHEDDLGPGHRKPVPWKDEYGTVLQRVLEVAKKSGRAIEVKVDIADSWPDDGREMLESPALTRLVQSEVPWKGFEYILFPFTSMDWLCNTLEFVRVKFENWEYFGVAMEDGPMADDSHSVADVLGKVIDMPKLQRLELELGWKGDWEWRNWRAWPSFPQLTVRDLRMRANETACVMVLKMCPRLATADIFVEGREGDELNDETRPPDDGMDVWLRELRLLRLGIGLGEHSWAGVLNRLHCPALQYFTFEWLSADPPEVRTGVTAFQRFVDTPRGTPLTGEVYFPMARGQDAEFIESRGLKKLVSPTLDHHHARPFLSVE